MTDIKKRILNKLSYLANNKEMQKEIGYTIDSVTEYGDVDRLEEYIDENPKVSWKHLEQHIYLYLLPVIIVSDDENPDFTKEYEFEERMKEKLSRFIFDEDSEFDVWNRCIMQCMQLRVTDEMEDYVDKNPNASLEELADYAKRIYIKASKAIMIGYDNE